MHLQGKHIAITGAAQGLGQAMAVSLAQQGAHIIGIDINKDKLSATEKLCKQHDVHFFPQITDISDEKQVEQLFASIKEIAPLDGLVNNAGIVRDALLLKAKEGQIVKKMSLANWQAVIDVNLTGVFLCTREAACTMIEHNNAGVIINISSVSRHGNMGQSNYTAAKAGVAAMTVTWAKELARYNIRVAGIAPGFIATELTEAMKPEALAKMTAMIPANRMGTVAEIASSVQYIFANDYFNGRILECDGGLRI